MRFPVQTWGRHIPGEKTNELHTRSASTARSSRIPIPTSVTIPPATGAGSSVDALAALTRFRVEFGHLEGPLQLCARCSPGGPATYWTRDLEEHLVTTPAE
jgi:hypothetical protein